jgi:hypothetical protein
LYVGANGQVLQSIEEENRGTTWENYFQSLMKNDPLNPKEFNQEANESNSLSHRVGEMLAHMKSFQ